MSTIDNFANPLDMPMLQALAQLDTKGEPIPDFTPDQIDACIAEYESAERLLASAKAVHTFAKAGLIALVQDQGARPTGAEYSRTLLGRRNRAMVTISNSTVLHEQYIDDLGQYCAAENLDSVFEKLFATITTHKLIEGARTVLGGLVLPKSKYDRILSLFGRCFEVKPKAPTVKVDLIEPEKPARKPRAKKAVA